MLQSQEDFIIHPIEIPTTLNLTSFNFYLIEYKNSLALIDAGVNSEKCWDIFNKTLGNLGFCVEDIEKIILTHNHEDHVGIINRILSIKNVPIYAHPEAIYRLKREKEYFTQRIDFFRQLYSEMGCGEKGEQQVSKLLKAMPEKEKEIVNGTIVPITESDEISGLKVIETPGHSPDHLVFLNERQKCLFSGDQLVHHISSNAIVEPDREGFLNPPRKRKRLR